LKEGERENREEGARWEKGKGQGVRAKRPSSSPDSEQERETGVASADGGRRQPGEGENGEGIEGISTTCSPWVGIACGGGSAVGNGWRRRLAAVAQLAVVVEQGRVVGARWRGEGRRGGPGLFVGGLRRFGEEKSPRRPRWVARQRGPRRSALNGVATSSSEVTARRGGVKAAAAHGHFAGPCNRGDEMPRAATQGR
jgi:hypothetical protein